MDEVIPILGRPAPSIHVKRWHCTRCKVRTITRDPRRPLPMHRCVGLGNMMAPLTEENEQAILVPVAREDYVGSERVQKDDAGRVWMAIKKRHMDGREDVNVFAPQVVGGRE